MHNIATSPVPNWSHLVDIKSPLAELFIGSIKEAYWCENHLVRTLLKMLNAASSANLKHLLSYHIERTKIHSTKIEHIFELLDETIDARKNDSISGLSTEANEIIEYTDEGTATRDMGIILVCQKIEQYEIVTYNGLIRLATTIGRDDIATLFGDILDDECQCLEALIDQGDGITLKAVAES